MLCKTSIPAAALQFADSLINRSRIARSTLRATTRKFGRFTPVSRPPDSTKENLLIFFLALFSEKKHKSSNSSTLYDTRIHLHSLHRRGLCALHHRSHRVRSNDCDNDPGWLHHEDNPGSRCLAVEHGAIDSALPNCGLSKRSYQYAGGRVSRCSVELFGIHCGSIYNHAAFAAGEDERAPRRQVLAHCFS